MADEPVYREGLWDCPNCGLPNKGREIKCGGCGQARENVEFYLPDDAEAVADDAGRALAAAGADWVCGYCETSNRGDVGACKGCGGDRAEGEKRKERVILDAKAAPVANAPPAKKGGGLGIVAILGALAAVCLLGCGIFAFLAWFTAKEERLTVASVKWERTIAIEDDVLVREEGWTVPAGARELRRFQKQDGTKKVQTGTERVKVGKKDLGNGMFEDVFEDRPVYKDEPNMRTRYEYEQRVWKTVRTERANGTSDPPRWPDVTLRGKEREKSGGRAESYGVALRAPDGTSYDWAPKDEAEWKRYAIGSEWVAQISLGSIRSLAPPGAAAAGKK